MITLKKILICACISFCASVFAQEGDVITIDFDSLEADSSITVDMPDVLKFVFHISVDDSKGPQYGMMTFAEGAPADVHFIEGIAYSDIDFFRNGYTFPPSPGGYDSIVISDSGHHIIWHDPSDVENATIQSSDFYEGVYQLRWSFKSAYDSEGDNLAIYDLSGRYTVYMYIDYDYDGLVDANEYKVLKIMF